MRVSLLTMLFASAVLSGGLHSATAAPAVTPDSAKVANRSTTVTTPAQQGRDPAEFPAYVEQLKIQARSQGITQATLDQAFADIHFVDRVIKSDRNQLEKKVTLDDYLQRTLPAQKIKQGKLFHRRYKPQLARASARYGVPERYIVALWGMESGFGKIQGKEDVISALATLAFEGRREAFFTKELMAALNIIQQGHVGNQKLKGSWAGAMGQNQFMPSSFLNYAVDGDDDGKIDIWTNVDDVFASTANYLSKEGWKTGESWGREVLLPANFKSQYVGLKNEQVRTLAEWQRMGVLPLNKKAFSYPALRAWVITPDNMQGRTFLVYDNFRTIMHWNRSYYFALSIGMMADGIVR